MLEVTKTSGQKLYVAPSQVVAVVPHSEEGYAELVMTVGENIRVKGDAGQIALSVSRALGQNSERLPSA
jgi:hypothetical protein